MPNCKSYRVKRIESIFAVKGNRQIVKQGFGHTIFTSSCSHFFNKIDVEHYLFKRSTEHHNEAVAARIKNVWWCCKRIPIPTSRGFRPLDRQLESYTNTVTLDYNLPIGLKRRLC